MKNSIVSTLSLALILGGCATASKDIPTSSISPLQYQPYDCTQISAEASRIQVRVSELGGRLDKAAANDVAIATVGAILFWPALFALGGTQQQEAEYGRLKGEYEALQQTAIAKKCPGIVAPAPAPAAKPVGAAAGT
ncbi:MAG: hypothetical protein ACKVOO_07765 [Burkholderiaceae bacterium]